MLKNLLFWLLLVIMPLFYLFNNFLFMNNLVKKSIYSTVWAVSALQIAISNAWWGGWMNFNPTWVQGWVKWTNNTADVAVQNLIGKLATFLTILAVMYALYWGFNILTAWGEEDKVKKGKTILTQALLWLVVIWLSYSIVSWLITLILPSA